MGLQTKKKPKHDLIIKVQTTQTAQMSFLNIYCKKLKMHIISTTNTSSTSHNNNILYFP